MSLPALYEGHFGRNHRRPMTAISLQAAEWLWRTLDARRPARILELGSGFSSTLFRTWQQVCPPCDVWTTDTEWRWLGATMGELELLGLDTSHCHHQDVFAHLPDAMLHGRFPFVFFDLDDTKTRLRWLSRVLNWLAPGGLLVLDDWHMDHYRLPAVHALDAAGFRFREVAETRDEFGRVLAVAERAAPV